MSELTNHYRALLGLDDSWEVATVDLKPDLKRVEIAPRHRGGKVVCPDCGKECSRADLAPERQWRHLDTMQFETILRARVPRVDCSACGVKTAAVPWAGKHSRFTLLFEAFAMEVLRACGSLSQACGLLRINWDTAHAIMERGVERGLSRRSTEEVKYVGMDEKNFGAGQSYVSIMTDLEQHRVLEVREGRTTESADQLWQTLPETQRSQVRAVSMDMWQPCERCIRGVLTLGGVYFASYLTNSVSEGFNSKIQSIKANARGFRASNNYRIRILFHCGKLDMNPLKAAH